MSESTLVSPAAAPTGIQRNAIYAALACAICMSMGPAVMLVGTFPLFLQPVSRDFGWGAALFPQMLLVSGTVGAVTGPFAGRLIDRRGVRPVLLCALVAWALSLAAMAFIEGSSVRLYAVSACAGLTSACCGPVALAKVVSGWFDSTRGLVMGLVLSAAPAAGTAIALVVMGLLIPLAGWRQAYILSGVTVLVIALPMALLFLREAPVVEQAAKPGERAGLPGMRLGEAIRTRAFWTLMLTAGICCGTGTGLSGHLMAWSTERGVGTGITTAALSGFSLIGPIGSLAAGMVADRFKGPRVLVIFFATSFLGALAMFVGGAPMLIPGTVLLGLGFAAGAGLTPYLVTRYFGLAYASEILGLSLGLLMLQIGLGPVLVGVAHDALGSYTAVIPIVLALTAGAAVLGATLPRYNPLFTPGANGPSGQNAATDIAPGSPSPDVRAKAQPQTPFARGDRVATTDNVMEFGAVMSPATGIRVEDDPK